MFELLLSEEMLGGARIVAWSAAITGAVLLVSIMRARSRRQSSIAQLARRRGRQLAEMIRLMRMAEEIAHLGLWQYFPGNGRQVWSGGMKKLFGAAAEEEFLPGDAETLLEANGIDPVQEVMSRSDLGGSFDLRFPIRSIEGEDRVLKMQACHFRNRRGEIVRVVGVVIDFTEAAQVEEELRQSREEALNEARRARELAETDPLSGLANRRRAMRELDRLVMRAREDAAPISLIVFDIDHFKQVNDNYGHQAGDEVIRQIAMIAREQARDGDVVARIGGEEFIWVVPGADGHFARLVAERLRLAISVGGAAGSVPAITVSVGIATADAHDTGLSLFARADAALYEAKHAGRNTVKKAA